MRSRKAVIREGADLPREQDAALNLRQGHADAYYGSTPGAVELIADLPDAVEMAGPEFEFNTRAGFAFRKGDEVTIESALHEIVADRTYRAMIAAWHFPPSVAYFDSARRVWHIPLA